MQLDRLKSMLNCQKVDKASLLSEAVSRLHILNQRCHNLETELATLKGAPAPAPLPETPAGAEAAEGSEAGDSTEVGGGLERMQLECTAVASQDAQHQALQEAELGEQQLQQWAQLGESALSDLIAKLEQAQWKLISQREEVALYAAQAPSANRAEKDTTPQPLEYCVKAETLLPLDPAVIANAYMDTDLRQKWHTSCTESRVVEELWPGTMRISHFTYRTELPVFPRGYCALIHRAQYQLPDGREQIIITDRSVAHSSVPASRHLIAMEVLPSGLVITPMQIGETMQSHVALVAHFDLKGSISTQLLARVLANKMLEQLCSNFLLEFRKHAISLAGVEVPAKSMAAPVQAPKTIYAAADSPVGAIAS